VELSHGAKVVRGLPAEWGTCSRTVALDSGLYALSCWRDTVAVGNQSGDIIILDAITGIQVAVLSGHTDQVDSLTFLSDGTSLVSGSQDTTLKLWDVQTGGVVKTFHGHTNFILSISISSDRTTIASGSRDRTTRLWDILSGECYCVIELQQSVAHVSFSPTNPQHLISVSEGVVQQWSTNGHQIGPTYQGFYAAFSLDSTCFILHGEKVITVQDSSSGEIVAKFPTPNSSLCCCCFSPNGRLIAAAAGTTAYIWDIASSDPYLIETFNGHTRNITSLTFSSSSSLISASWDKTVRFWQIGASSTDLIASDPQPIQPGSVLTQYINKFWQVGASLTGLVANDPKPTPPVSAPIRSIALQATDGIAISSDSDGVVRTWDLSTGHCKASFQTPAQDSHPRDVQLVDSRLIFVWCTDEKIYIQDAEKATLLQTVDAPGAKVFDIRISGDGSKIFRLDESTIQAWSIRTGEAVGEVYHELSLSGNHLITQGSKVWVLTDGWDFRTLGSSPIRLPAELPERHHLDFVGGVREDRRHIPGIEDTVTRKKVFQLPPRLVRSSDSQWDGQYLAAGYENGEVMILDFNHVLLQ
jgi:WD40 repeat protein